MVEDLALSQDWLNIVIDFVTHCAFYLIASLALLSLPINSFMLSSI